MLGVNATKVAGKGWMLQLSSKNAGNALERVQRVHEPADLQEITF